MLIEPRSRALLDDVEYLIGGLVECRIVLTIELQAIFVVSFLKYVVDIMNLRRDDSVEGVEVRALILRLA